MGLLPAGRESNLRPGLQRLLSSRGKLPPPEEKDVPFGTSEKRAFSAPDTPERRVLRYRVPTAPGPKGP